MPVTAFGLFGPFGLFDLFGVFGSFGLFGLFGLLNSGLGFDFACRRGAHGLSFTLYALRPGRSICMHCAQGAVSVCTAPRAQWVWPRCSEGGHLSMTISSTVN